MNEDKELELFKSLGSIEEKLDNLLPALQKVETHEKYFNYIIGIGGLILGLGTISTIVYTAIYAMR